MTIYLYTSGTLIWSIVWGLVLFALKGLNQGKLSFSMLKSHDSWPLWQGSFPPKLKIKDKKHIFLKILEIVCISELGTGKEKCISEIGTGKEIGSQIWGPEKKMYPKSRTGKENVSQKWGPENKLVLKSGDRKDFFRSHLLRVKFFSGPYFWDTFSFPVPIFESNFLFRSPILRYTFLFRSPILRHTLSLEFGEKCVFCPSFQALGGKNPDTGVRNYGFLTY